MKTLLLSLPLVMGCARPPVEDRVPEEPQVEARDVATEPGSGNQPSAKPPAEKPPAETPPAEKPSTAAKPTPGEAQASRPAPKLVDLPKNTRVLHVGDSFAGALGYALNRELKEHDVEGIIKYEKSTYIPTWAWNKELPQYLWKYHPDVVLITLGGNELKIPDPDARAKTVRRLVKRLKGKPCVWVGIPLWEGANPALMGVIRDNVEPCLFLDSAKLLPDLERAGDGIHPNTEARTVWAKAVIHWLRQQLKPGADGWVWRESAGAEP